MTDPDRSRPVAAHASRRTFMLITGAGVLGIGAMAAPTVAHACTVINKCGTIVISRSGPDVVVVVTDSSGAAASGAAVSARKGRGRFDEQKTGSLGKTTHSLGVVKGDAVDVVVSIGGCLISKSDCVLT